MVRNNIEIDVKMRCIEKATTQAKIAENIEELPLTIDEDMKKDTSEEYLGCVGNCIELLEKRQM